MAGVLSVQVRRGVRPVLRYYTHRAELAPELAARQPRWHGSGARQQGLAGPVSEAALERALAGHTPAGRHVRNAGADRASAYDLTFSADKPLSVLHALAPAPQRQAIEEAFTAAALATLSLAEEELAVARRGAGGHRAEKVGLAVAVLPPHYVARPVAGQPPDPQLHQHCLVLNLALTEDGRARALDGRAFFRGKMMLGAGFRVELTRLLRTRLGLEYESAAMPGALPRLVAPQELFTTAEECSKRRSQILRAAPSARHSARAAARATVLTRAPKASPSSWDEARRSWEETARRHGFGPEHAARFLTHARAARLDPVQELERCLERAEACVGALRDAADRTRYLRAVFEEGIGCGLELPVLARAAAARVADPDFRARLGLVDHPARRPPADRAVWPEPEASMPRRRLRL